MIGTSTKAAKTKPGVTAVLVIGVAVGTTGNGTGKAKTNPPLQFVEGNVLMKGAPSKLLKVSATLDPAFFGNPNVGLLIEQQNPSPGVGEGEGPYIADPQPKWMLLNKTIVKFDDL